MKAPRFVRLALWFVFGVVLGGYSVASWAGAASTHWTYSGTTQFWPDGPSALVAECTSKGLGGATGYWSGNSWPTQTAQCWNGSQWSGAQTVTGSYYCTGTDQLDNTTNPPTCSPANPCSAKSGQTAGRQVGFEGYDLNNTGTATTQKRDNSKMCVDSCEAGYAVPGNYNCWGDGPGFQEVYCAADYQYTGSACTASDSAPAAPGSQPPCPTGYTMGTVNGASKCLPSGGGATQTPPPVSPQSKTTENTVTNADGSKTTTTTTTSTDGSTSTTVTTTAPDGSKTSTTTGTGGTMKPGDNPVKDFCTQNPNALMCKSDNPSSGVGSTGLGSWYTKEGVTIDDKFQTFTTRVKQLPLFSSVGNFFAVNVTGSCPSWNLPGVAMPFGGHLPAVTIDAQCNMEGIWPFIAAIIMASGAWLAWRIALL